MLLKSEIDSGVVGRSTYFTRHYHVDDQNTHRHDDEEQSIIYAEGNSTVWWAKSKPTQSFWDGWSSEGDKQHGSDNLLHPAWSAVHLSLFTCIIFYQSLHHRHHHWVHFRQHDPYHNNSCFNGQFPGKPK